MTEDGAFTGHTLCLGSPVYTVRTVIGRVLSTTLDRRITLGGWEEPGGHAPFLDSIYLVAVELEFVQDLKPTVHTSPFFTRQSRRSRGSTGIG